MVADDPESFADLDGHCCSLDDVVDFVAGAVNALSSNNGTAVRKDAGGDRTFKSGQIVGDTVAAIQGGAEVLLGAGGEIGGATLDATGIGAIVGVPANVVSAGVIAHGGAVGLNGLNNLLKSSNEETSSSSSASETQQSSSGSVRGAQREAMRQEGIPTSQQPSEQVSTKAGRQYTYEVAKPGGGKETKIVTRQHADRNHGTHVEAGSPKPNGQTDPSGRLRHKNNKTKVDVSQ